MGSTARYWASKRRAGKRYTGALLVSLAVAVASLGCEARGRSFGATDAAVQGGPEGTGGESSGGGKTPSGGDDFPGPGSEGENRDEPAQGGASSATPGGVEGPGATGTRDDPAGGGAAGFASAGGGGQGGGAPPVLAGCGNAIVEPGEDCDDGEANSDDTAGACSTSCTLVACGTGDSRPCSAAGALGNCAAGEQVCKAGVWGECGVVPAAADGCEPGDDADCDGVPNEGCACVVGETASCGTLGALGQCAMGTVICDASGQYGLCDVEPAAADSCDVAGDDSNCNGVPSEGCACTDEGAEQPCGPPTDAGRCTFGVSRCEDGAWTVCEGAVYPAARDCASTSDNDCDGKADNTVDAVCQCQVGATQACDAHPGLDGTGRCRAGSRTCVAGSSGASSNWGSCTGSVGPAASDSCAMLGDDANCDGTENGGCACIASETTTCAAEYQYQGDCGDYTLTCSATGTWPAAATACAARTGDTCAAPGQCLPGVWGDPDSTWGSVCWE